MSFVEGRVRVRVPATSANLGPGFDALGLALALYDEVGAQVTSEGLTVDVHGEGADAGERVARDETHLVVRAMRAAFTAMDEMPPGLAIACDNSIPHSRGLGSSSAAICAGVLLARALVVDGGQRLPDDAVLALANALEGHPDNVAPCLLGGLTIAWVQGATAHAVRRDIDPSIVPVALVPPFTASTELARGPAAHDRSALRRRARGRSGGTAGRGVDGRDRRVVRGDRGSVAPGLPRPGDADSAALVTSLRADGLPAVISGAGPTVLVLTTDLGAVRDRAPEGWRVLSPGVDVGGAQLNHGDGGTRQDAPVLLPL